MSASQMALGARRHPYGSAVIIAVASVMVAGLLPLPGGPFVWLPVAGVVICAWLLGPVAALVATVVSVLSAAYVLFPPLLSLEIAERAHLVELLVAGGLMLLTATVVPPLVSARAGNSRCEMSASQYDALAWVYNQEFGPDSCRHVLAAFDRLIAESVPENAHLLDVCCGSGNLTQALVERGYWVTAVDGSREMVELTRQNAPNCRVYLQDAGRLDVGRKFHAAICGFNSIGHFHSSDEVLAVFQGIRQALCDGGYFLFDFYTERAYQRRWRGVFASVRPDYVYVVRPSYDPEERLGANEITILQGNKTYKRSDVRLTMKCHDVDELQQLLRRAGFEDITTHDAERDLGIAGEADRLFVLARRGAKNPLVGRA